MKNLFNFVNSLENLWIALVLTGYNIVLFAIYPSLFVWISSLFTVCMILWLAAVYENKQEMVKYNDN